MSVYKCNKEMDLLKRAERGDIESQSKLVIYYYFGDDFGDDGHIDPDRIASDYWKCRIEEAARKGNRVARGAIASWWRVKDELGKNLGYSSDEIESYRNQLLIEAESSNIEAMYLIESCKLLDDKVKCYIYLFAAGHYGYSEAYYRLMNLFYFAQYAKERSSMDDLIRFCHIDKEVYEKIIQDYDDLQSLVIYWAIKGAESNSFNADKCKEHLTDYYS